METTNKTFYIAYPGDTTQLSELDDIVLHYLANICVSKRDFSYQYIILKTRTHYDIMHLYYALHINTICAVRHATRPKHPQVQVTAKQYSFDNNTVDSHRKRILDARKATTISTVP